MAEVSDNEEVLTETLLGVANEAVEHDHDPDALLRIATLITAGRRSGVIPPGPPSRVLAHALVGVIEGVRIRLEGQAPFDVLLAERAALGLLGLAPTSGATGTT